MINVAITATTNWTLVSSPVVGGNFQNSDLRMKLKDIPTHKVPKDVDSVEVGHLTASVDVASRHRFAQLVRVGKDWQDVT